VELYDRELVEQLGLNCLRILDQAIENDSLTIGDIAFLTDEEKRKILFEFNDTRMDFPRDKTIYRFVEDHAEMTPHHIAVTGMPHNGKWGIELTYRVLNERANRMARKLRNTCIGTDDLVGILMERSLVMMISILAIWKAGGAYIPLDPKNPPQRILEILNDSGSKVLIAAENGALSQVKKEYRGLIINTTASDDHELTHESPVDISNRTAKFDMNGLAYVIYTSGSTGKPKGAMIEHIGMMNHIHAKVNELQLTAKSVVLQNAAHTFDISVWQFFSAVIPAGKTIIYPEEVILDPGKFISRIAGDQITILEVVPSYLAALMEYLWEGHTLPLALQYLLVTGEEVKPHLIRKWFERYPGIPMVNAYGPTEASDDITHYFMDKDPGIDHIPIGKPLQNLNIYITDNNMNLCPIGVKGEICVSGVGVGRGYLGDEEKTRHVFMEDPFINEKGVRLYKTGDIGLWLPDGNIQFFGRKDYQVKIRGFRIELGEIEKKLLSHPQIKETVVTDKEDKYGNKYLCAYIVPHANNLPGITELKRYLADSLPEYMIPAHFEILKKIPLSSSGKVDRKALPIPDEIEIAQKYTAPTNHIEEKLVEIWAEVLDKEKSVIGTEHSFFDLGGHSLRAIVLVSKIHKEFDVKIPLVELFRTPVIKQLSLYIEKAAKDRFASIETIEKKEYYALSSAQKRLYILQQMDPASTAYNMPEVIPLMVTPDLEKFKNTFIRLITRHESLRTSFHLVNDEPVQRIQDGVEFEIGYYELNADDRERMKVVNIFDRAFDLTEAPLLKAGVVKTVAAQYFLVVVMHHIISDGISHQVLANDFMTLFSDDRDEALTPLRIQYKDFSHWQNSPQERNRIKNQEVYWLKEFAGEIPLLKLPTDFPRPHVQLFKGSSLHGSIPIDTEKFKTLAFENDVTSFMVFLAIFNIFLYKMSGQEDIVIGTPVSGRRHADLEKIIGMFVNSLPLRNQPHGEMSFAGFLKDVRRNTLAAFENQEYQFEDLVEKLPVKRDRHNPIFDVMFTCREKKFDARDEDEAKEEIAAASLKQNAYNYVEFRTSKFDFTLNIVIAKKLLFSFEYSSELFKRETIEMFADGFKEIVSAIMADTNIKLKDINITTFLADTDSSAVQEELTGMDF
ncbi:MAG TPA: amino acid adenylation domain-containing protein, partial [Candidatus Kapabacteria bacterium]|nr:amino acid adenylation domain-containing protein [Candidatus Kapabacteria bacterium]